MEREEKTEAAVLPANPNVLYRNLFSNLILNYLYERGVTFCGEFSPHIQEIFNVSRHTAADIFQGKKSKQTRTIEKLYTGIMLLTEKAEVIEIFKSLYQGIKPVISKNIEHLFINQKGKVTLVSDNNHREVSGFEYSRTVISTDEEWERLQSYLTGIYLGIGLTSLEIAMALELCKNKKMICAQSFAHIDGFSYENGISFAVTSLNSKLEYTGKTNKFYLVSISDTSTPQFDRCYTFKYAHQKKLYVPKENAF